MPHHADPETEPDFDLGLSISEKPGTEFASIGFAGMGVQIVSTQAFAALFMIPPLVFFAVRRLIGAQVWVASVIAIIAGLILLLFGIRFLLRIKTTSPGRRLETAHTDTRYRVRAAVPADARNPAFPGWLSAFTGQRQAIDPVTPGQLAATPGGFEPVIARPWFGIKRTKAYLWTGIVCGIAAFGTASFLLQLAVGGWGAMGKNMGLFGYAMTGLSILAGTAGAELCWPVYLRLAPGRLDVFRYGLLGRGLPSVATHDLRTLGVCVDFGGFAIALQSPRPPGQPAPELVSRKNRLPLYKTHRPEDRPTYYAVVLSSIRTEFCKRLIQAARSEEPTPPLPLDRLSG